MSAFPRDFLWGISSAAFQYEMGASEKALDPNSDWYAWLHDRRNLQLKMVSGDLPENGPGYWDLYKSDHEWARWLGLNAWRINPEWSRIFPSSTEDVKVSVSSDDEGIKDVDITEGDLRKLDKVANKYAVRHYGEIFRDLKARGFRVVLNLYHWPMPLWVHDPIKARDTNSRDKPNGWVEQETVVEFSKFAAYVAWKFGTVPHMWSTMNEPNVVWDNGYMAGNFPPGLKDPGLAERVALNLTQAHARAYDQIKRIVGRRAKVGVIYATIPSEPLSDSEADREAAVLRDEVETKWFFRAVAEGRPKRGFFGEEVRRPDMRGKVDWIGVNYYSRNVVKHVDTHPYYEVQPDYGFRCKASSVSAAGNPTGESGWEVYPQGVREALGLYKEFEKPLMVSENGIADSKDKQRPWYVVSHVHNIRGAMEEGLKVLGYFHWSLIDNLEWTVGFRIRFGLIYVDMLTKRRYPRPSAYLYRDIASGNAVPRYLSEYAKFPNSLAT